MAAGRNGLDLGGDPAPDKDSSDRIREDFWPEFGIQCAFSTQVVTRMGAGGNTRNHEGKLYWFVEQVTEDQCEVRLINERNVPSGDFKTISLHQLVRDYSPELVYYEDVVLPAMLVLDRILSQGDGHRKNGKLGRAESDYIRALSIDEVNVRALFGLGLVYADRQQVERTRAMLSQLVNVRAAFDGKNQHLFNALGIALRKAGLCTEAVAYYRRALDFVKDDENLYYNLARAHYEDGDWGHCLEALIRCHRLNPGLPVARDLFHVMVGLADNARLLERYGKPPVPLEVAERARRLLAVERGESERDEAPVHNGGRLRRARGGGVLTLSLEPEKKS